MKKNPLKQYENQINTLETIVQALENGDLTLDEALAQYEQGIKLVRQCQHALTQAEQKILQLSCDENGEEALIPFRDDTDEEA